MQAVSRLCSLWTIIALAVCKTLAITKAANWQAYGCPLLAKMEQVFVVHYDKLEVGRNECYATDAEVVGVFLQRCSAIECARAKVEELIPRFDYFAEGENEEDG